MTNYLSGDFGIRETGVVGGGGGRNNSVKINMNIDRDCSPKTAGPTKAPTLLQTFRPTTSAPTTKTSTPTSIPYATKNPSRYPTTIPTSARPTIVQTSKPSASPATTANPTNTDIVKDCEFVHSESQLPLTVKSTNVINAMNMKCMQIVVTNLYDSVGDIRGVFFNLNSGFDESKIGSISIKIRSWIENGSYASVDRSGSATAYQCKSAPAVEFSQLHGDVNMNGDSGGSYTCAVEVSSRENFGRSWRRTLSSHFFRQQPTLIINSSITGWNTGDGK